MQVCKLCCGLAAGGAGAGWASHTCRAMRGTVRWLQSAAGHGTVESGKSLSNAWQSAVCIVTASAACLASTAALAAQRDRRRRSHVALLGSAPLARQSTNEQCYAAKRQSRLQPTGPPQFLASCPCGPCAAAPCRGYVFYSLRQSAGTISSVGAPFGFGFAAERIAPTCRSARSL